MKNNKTPVIIRKLDELGRVVIPAGIRRILELKEKAPLNVILLEDRFILEKHFEGQSRFKKPIGLIRKLDELGRIVIPKELLNEMELHENDMLYICADFDNEQIYIETQESVS